MKTHALAFSCLFVPCLLSASPQAAAFQAVSAPTALSVEYRDNPVGLDATRPRLGWRMAADGGAKDVFQASWCIEAASSLQNLLADRADLWKSGETVGTALSTVWGGKALASSQRVWWRVRTRDSRGILSPWSEPARFTMGIMRAADWKAKWIGPAPETRPDADFGTSAWQLGVAMTGTVALAEAPAPGEVISFVHLATRPHVIRVNGRVFQKPRGHVLDWRFARFRNIAPYLTAGTNVFEVTLDAASKNVRELSPVAAPPAFIGVLRTGGMPWKDISWTGSTPGGRIREAPWGAAAILREEVASPAFAKTFVTRGKPVAATLHVTGLGFYEAYLNGVRIGDKVLDPAPTAYDRRVLYSTYELDDAVRAGENELRILVGHGWYDVRSIPTWNFENAPWRDFPRAIAQLELTYADGSRACVVTDGSWRHVFSPVGYDCIREGEVIGAADVRAPDFEAAAIAAVEVPAPKGLLQAEAQPGARVIRTVAPQAVRALGAGTYVVDFPESMAGWVRLTLRGQRRGDTLVVRYDERVDARGGPAPASDDALASRPEFHSGLPCRRVDQSFAYAASHEVSAAESGFQTDRFVSSGAPVERYEPRFTYNGFRHVVLRGLRRAPRAEDICGCVVSTDFKAIGSFVSSDATLNTLMEMTARAYRSNFADGVPTDCPHREKNGWTGDASCAAELAQFFFENTAGYEKFLRDIGDAQTAAGELPGIVPTSGWGFAWGNGPAWDSALPVIAWTLWNYRDDRTALEIAYPILVKYLAFTATKADAANTVRHGLGDWVPVMRGHMPSIHYTSSCYYLQAQQIAARIAAILGHAADAERFAAGAAKTRAGLRATFLKGGGTWENGLQTAQAMALAYGLCDTPEERAATAAGLVKAVEDAGRHVDFGLLGSKQVFRQLGEIGRFDLAVDMLTNPTPPGPAEWIRRGEGGDALWENWTDGSSRNHIMFGDFAACLYEYLAGIRLPEGGTSAVPEPAARGGRAYLIAPQFVPQINFVNANVEAPNGRVAVRWRRKNGVLHVNVDIPANSRATIRLPGRADASVTSGAHYFKITEK